MCVCVRERERDQAEISKRSDDNERPIYFVISLSSFYLPCRLYLPHPTLSTHCVCVCKMVTVIRHNGEETPRDKYWAVPGSNVKATPPHDQSVTRQA